MHIEEKTLQHWTNFFYGYGSWDARIWFVGYEEGGGDLPEEVAEKFDYFFRAHNTVSTPTLCDIRDLYQHVTARLDGSKAGVYANLHEYRFGPEGMQQGIWKNLIAFVHGYRNRKLPDLLAYQKNTLASTSDQNEALIQLYPLPSPHNHAWYYSWLDMPRFGFLKSRALYQAHFYEGRIRKILQKVREHQPDVVLMYGMDNINILKTSVQESFPDARFKMVKGIKLQTPQHHRSDVSGTTFLITTQIPALRHNRIETGFDWEAFGKAVKAETL